MISEVTLGEICVDLATSSCLGDGDHHGKDQFVFPTPVELPADRGLQFCIRKGADEAKKYGLADDITHAGIEKM